MNDPVNPLFVKEPFVKTERCTCGAASAVGEYSKTIRDLREQIARKDGALDNSYSRAEISQSRPRSTGGDMTDIGAIRNGKKLSKYLFSYGYNGAIYSFHVPAYSEQEAVERVAKMAWAKYDGILMAEIPAARGMRPFADLFIRLMNWWSK